MKERPILFSAPMVRALLAGTKTQTRRAMKPQPTHMNPAGIPRLAHLVGPSSVISCPYGQAGDRLWVRETSKAIELPSGLDGVRYAADETFRPIENTREASEAWMAMHWYRGGRGLTVPGIHMPRWASRITLEVTGVRVERLQDISEVDAQDEGITAPMYPDDVRGASYALAYRHLWDSINGPGVWERNPFVWCVTFRRVA